MTFAEYNTDANFDNDKSSLDELVKIGLSEGKTSDEIKSSLSPKWQNSKKIGEFDSYVSKYSTPKAEEQKPTEEKVVETVTQTTAPKEETLKQDSKAANRQNKDSLTQEQIEYETQRKNKQQAWDNMLDTAERQKEAFNNIDDHMVEQLPTFMFKRYQNGEFGKPESTDAKLRLAHFMINGVGTALSNISHVIRKDGVQEQSDAEKYQQTNLEEGLKNRWQKYKEETQAAVELAKQRGIADEDLNEAIAKISSNNRLQASFNRMNEEQKVFTLQVMSEIGDEMGNMSDEKFFNTLVGFATSGDSLDYKEAAAMLVYRYVKDPEKKKQILSNLGFGDIDGVNVAAGFGGALFGGSKDDKESDTGTTLEDGTKIDPGKAMSKKELEELRAEAQKLGDKLYNGEITEDEFRKDYVKLENIMSQHGVRSAVSGGIMSADSYIKQIAKNKLTELSNSLYDLNDNAKNYTKDEYLKKYDDLKAQAVKWGISEKDLKSVEKDKEKALKKVKK